MYFVATNKILKRVLLIKLEMSYLRKTAVRLTKLAVGTFVGHY